MFKKAWIWTNVVSDLEDGMFYMWVDKHYLSFYSLIMEAE